MDGMLDDHYDVKRFPRLGPGAGREGRYLKRLLGWPEGGYSWEADPIHAQRMIEDLEMQDAKPASTPGSKDAGKGENNLEDQLDAHRAAQLARNGGRGLFLVTDRPGSQYSVKNIMREVKCLTELAWLRLTRFVRWLIECPQVIWWYDYQPPMSKATPWTDSDWAGDQATRRSTNCVLLYHGDHLLESTSAGQQVIAISSGEGEVYSIGTGAALGLGLRELLQECGYECKVEVLSDSSAGRGIANRMGTGRVKHRNRADLGTKYHEPGEVNRILKNIKGVEFARRLPAAAILTALSRSEQVREVDGSGDVVLLNFDLALAGRVGRRVCMILELLLVVLGILMLGLLALVIQGKVEVRLAQRRAEDAILEDEQPVPQRPPAVSGGSSPVEPRQEQQQAAAVPVINVNVQAAGVPTTPPASVVQDEGLRRRLPAENRYVTLRHLRNPMRDELRRRGLPTSGVKEGLAERLRLHDITLAADAGMPPVTTGGRLSGRLTDAQWSYLRALAFRENIHDLDLNARAFDLHSAAMFVERHA